MAITLTHTTVAVGTDAGNGEIAKAQWNENHTLTLATDKLLGRATAGTGAVEEITCTAAGRALLDDASAADQRTTLELGTANSPQFTGIELGHASDTTITRSSAGVVAVEGVTVALNSTGSTHTAGTIELGAATDTTISRAAAGVIAVEGIDVLLAGKTDTITVGYTVTPYNIGTVSSGTTTPNAANGNYQYYTNNGAHTLAAPSSDCAIDILVTNGASAGAITFSGFTVGSSTGSTYATTNTNKYILSIRRINAVATYSWYALQ